MVTKTSPNIDLVTFMKSIIIKMGGSDEHIENKPMFKCTDYIE